MQELPLSYRTLGGIKDALQYLLMNDEAVRSLVMPKLDDDRVGVEENWKGGTYTIRSNGKTEQIDLNGHCFVEQFVMETIKDDTIMICIETGVNTSFKPNVKSIFLYINVYAYKDRINSLTEEDRELENRMRSYGYTGNRVDMVVASICHLLDTTKQLTDELTGTQYGIGNIRLYSHESLLPYKPNNRFYGKQIIYELTDFSVTSTTPKREVG